MRRLTLLLDSDGSEAPVAIVRAIHNCETAAKGSVDDGEGLEPVLYLGRNVKSESNVTL